MNDGSKSWNRRQILLHAARASAAFAIGAPLLAASKSSFGQSVRTFHIDGRLYTEDQLSDEAHEDIRQLPFIAVSAEGLKNRTAYGFTSPRAYEHWVARSGFSGAYGKLMGVINGATYAPEREAAMARQQASHLDQETDQFLIRLKQHNVATNNASAILRLFEEKKLGQSMVLWRYPNYDGRLRYFPSTTPVPNYSWIDFNNMPSSAVHGGAASALFQQKWFGPRVIALFGVLRVDRLGDAPFYFNNLTSSSGSA